MNKYLWLLLLFLTACAAGGAPTDAAEPAPTTAPAALGTLTGHVDIGPLAPVMRADEPAPTPSPQVYAAWVLLILSPDGQQEIARVDIAADGTYTVSLPPGDYLLTGRQREGKAMLVQQQYPVTVLAGQVTEQDVSLDTGIR